MVQALHARPHGIYADCTVGDGGHAEAILEATRPDGILIGLDRDEAAIRRAGERLKGQGARVRLFCENFINLGALLKRQGVSGVDGVLMDLGVSTLQLSDPSRGFSFQQDGPLDMRMDRKTSVTAADWVNSLPERRLAQILLEYGEERWARRIARAVADSRQKTPITTTRQLAELIRRAVPRPARMQRIHPATRTFQALRIVVNQELNPLAGALTDAASILNPGGRLCVIAFHSLEDRIVKRTFRRLAQDRSAGVRLVARKPIVPTEEEIERNPRARSAKLRAVERVAVASVREGRGAA